MPPPPANIQGLRRACDRRNGCLSPGSAWPSGSRIPDRPRTRGGGGAVRTGIVPEPVSLGEPGVVGARDLRVNCPVLSLAPVQEQVSDNRPGGADPVPLEQAQQFSVDSPSLADGGEEPDRIWEVKHPPSEFQVNRDDQNTS